MTFQRKEITVLARTESQIVAITCDVCGKTFRGAQREDLSIGWGTGFDIRRTAAVIEEGKRFPEIGFVDRREYHVCPGCSEQKIGQFVKVLELHGEQAVIETRFGERATAPLGGPLPK